MNNTINGFQPMYGTTNFVDMLFLSISKEGLSGISLAFFFNLYLYQSIGKIKELCEWLNTQVSTNAKHYGHEGFNYLKTYFTGKMTKWINSMINKVKSLIWWIKKPSPIIPNSINSVEETLKNSFEVHIDLKNKADLMSIGNLIVNQMSEYQLIKCLRTDSSAEYSVESYQIPSNLSLFKNKELEIKLEQNVNLEIECESNHQLLNLKNINTTSKNSGELVVSSNELNTISNLLIQVNMNSNNIYANSSKPHVQMPCIGNSNYWAYPETLFAGLFKKLLNLIFLNEDKVQLKNLFNAVIFKQPLIINQRTYKLSNVVYPAFNYSTSDYTEELVEQITNLIMTEVIKCNKKYKSLVKPLKLKTHDIYKDIFKPPGEIDNIKIIFSSIDLSIYQLNQRARQWLGDKLETYYKSNQERFNKKITIYKMVIDYKKTVEEVDNPSYIKWRKKYQIFIDDKDKLLFKPKKYKKDKEEEEEVDQYAELREQFEQLDWSERLDAKDPPPQKVSEIKYIPFVKTEVIKSDKKPLKYLYLPQEEKRQLVSYLKNFKENRNIYEEYGFPYRAGLCLSGPPGGGKSSTIIASATYLGKDIFYLDLGAIQTNEHLKLCMDYVKKSSKNGGVVVFEDIDAMTNIVHRRDQDYLNNEHLNQDDEDLDIKDKLLDLNIQDSFEIKSRINLEKMDKNDSLKDPLSLSFLLNVLDGTMCPENVIFIMTTNHPEKLDPALTRYGRIDLKFELMECNRYQFSCIYRDLYKKELSEELLNQFREGKYTTAHVISHLFHNIHNDEISEEELISPFV